MKKVIIKVGQMITVMNQLCKTHFDAEENNDKVITIFDDGSVEIHSVNEKHKELLTD